MKTLKIIGTVLVLFASILVMQKCLSNVIPTPHYSSIWLGPVVILRFSISFVLGLMMGVNAQRIHNVLWNIK